MKFPSGETQSPPLGDDLSTIHCRFRQRPQKIPERRAQYSFAEFTTMPFARELISLGHAKLY